MDCALRSRCHLEAQCITWPVHGRVVSLPWRSDPTRYDRRTGPSHGLTAPSSLVQRDIYVEDASVLLRAFCTITQDGCLRIVNWAAHALVLDPWPATTWHIPIAWLVPTGNVGYTPLDNLHCAIGVRSLLTVRWQLPHLCHESILYSTLGELIN